MLKLFYLFLIYFLNFFSHNSITLIHNTENNNFLNKINEPRLLFLIGVLST
jgi:hypothetical protein